MFTYLFKISTIYPLFNFVYDPKNINMKRLLTKIWEWVKNLYDGLMGGTKKYVPIAIRIVEALKSVMDSPVDDVILAIVKMAIPGDADDKVIDKVKYVVENWVPKVLLELKIVHSIADMTDKNQQLQAILDELKKLSPETQAIVWHGFASLCIEKLSDGKVDWSDAVALAEWFYRNIHKNQVK